MFELTGRKRDFQAASNIHSLEDARRCVHFMRIKNCYATSHTGHNPQLADWWRQLSVRMFWMTRDPRDIVISLADWWNKGYGRKCQDFYPWFRNLTPNEQYRFVIRTHGAKGVRNVYQKYMGWITEPDICGSSGKWVHT